MKTIDWLAVLLKEKMVMVDLPRKLESSSQYELATQDIQRSCGQLHPPIFTGLGRVFVNPRNPGLSDLKRPPGRIKIRNQERDLLRGAHSGEEAELIVVALPFAPIPTDCGDECFCVLNGEGIDFCPVLLQNARTLETGSRVVLLWLIAIAEFECPSQHADRIVVGLFSPVRGVRDFDECRVANVEEADGSNPWTPDSIEDLSLGGQSHGGHIVLCYARSQCARKASNT